MNNKIGIWEIETILRECSVVEKGMELVIREPRFSDVCEKIKYLSDRINNEKEERMKVKVYMISNAIHYFPARDINNAREIAKRIIMEGLWTEEETFYPITQIYKVKIELGE